MDELRFEALLRALGSGTSRRRGLAVLGAVVAGAGLGATDAARSNRAESRAACRPAQSACSKNKQCCGKRCVDGVCDADCAAANGPCDVDADCCASLLCNQGTCTARTGRRCSGWTCDGCCNGNICKPGTSNTACGKNGQACRSCPSTAPVCSEGTCGPCGGDADCSGTTPYCDSGVCTECAGAGDCGTDEEACVAAACTCGSDISCRGETPLCCSVLGAVSPVAAPGYRLQMTQLVWEPGSVAVAHSHPIAQVACVQSGALGMVLHQGAATVTRGGTGTGPTSIEPMPLGTEVVIGPRDCIAYDEFAEHTVHTVWNASDGTTVLWMSDLVKKGEPYTEFPVPADEPQR